MGLVEVIDRHIPSHGNSRELSWGWTLAIWLTCCVSTGNHQKLPVREWVAHRIHTLSSLSGQQISELDFTDDRLTNLLAYLSKKSAWHRVEHDFSQSVIEIYDLETNTFRVDATTISGHHQKSLLFQFGKSKSNPNLRQIKLMIASLDPLSMPVACDLVSGEKADDPLYIPCIDRVRSTIGKTGLLFVGDCKMGAFETRLHLAGHSQRYLCPLAHVGKTAEDFPGWVKDGLEKAETDELTDIYREDYRGKTHLIAKGYEFERQHKGTLNDKEVVWTERALMVRSLAHARTEQMSLKKRLDKVKTALLALTPKPGRGKRQIRDEETMQKKIGGILKTHRVTGLLAGEYERQATSLTKYKGRGRGSANREKRIEEKVRYQMTDVVENDSAIQKQIDIAGWRVYVTNAEKATLSLEKAILEYREEYRVENVFHRLKSTLNIEALWVKRDDQIIGMNHFVTLAVRILTLAEFVVRRSLKENETELMGLHQENTKKKTSKPTAERILKAFSHITLNIYENGIAIVTPITDIQKKILYHLGMDKSIYLNLEKVYPE